jgi:uncharacterized Ntn-hydrolase superfamily protein
MFGVAVSSSSPAVAARCAHARAGIGAVATQNITDPTIGPRGLDAMATGLSAQEALEHIKASSSHIEFRQIGFVDRFGGSACHSGSHALGIFSAHAFENGVVAGNLLANTDVLPKMAEYFQSHPHEDLGDRLVHTLQTGMQAGGEAGPVHSAGLILVRDVAWPVADLRVDWHEMDPIGELAKLWELWKPQMDAYVTRALHPSDAPSYGVPGDT